MGAPSNVSGDGVLYLANNALYSHLLKRKVITDVISIAVGVVLRLLAGTALTLLAICASLALLSYMLYTVSSDTIRLHHTDKLVYTVPFVAYGIFRFIFKVQEGRGTGPVEIFLSDPIFQLNSRLWAASVILIRILW